MEPHNQQPTTPAPTLVHPNDNKHNNFFALLGKVFLALIIITGLVFGGYYLGQTSQTKNSSAVSPTPVPRSLGEVGSPTTPISQTEEEKLSEAKSASGGKTKTVKAGLTDSTAFKPYSIEVPPGWTDVRENTQAAGIDKLTLSKNGYTLTIYQAAMGGGGCTYKGEPEQMMSQSYTDFVEINGVAQQYRRSWNQTAAKTTSYAICQKGTDSAYGTVSSFGAISAVSPNPADAIMLAEIDSMIASLVKQ